MSAKTEGLVGDLPGSPARSRVESFRAFPASRASAIKIQGGERSPRGAPKDLLLRTDDSRGPRIADAPTLGWTSENELRITSEGLGSKHDFGPVSGSKC